MVIAQPAPFVSTFVDAVDQAIREHIRATAYLPCSVPGSRFVSPLSLHHARECLQKQGTWCSCTIASPPAAA